MNHLLIFLWSKTLYPKLLLISFCKIGTLTVIIYWISLTLPSCLHTVFYLLVHFFRYFEKPVVTNNMVYNGEALWRGGQQEASCRLQADGTQDSCGWRGNASHCAKLHFYNQNCNTNSFKNAKFLWKGSASPGLCIIQNIKKIG